MVYNFDCEWNALQARPAMTRLLLVTFVENVEGGFFRNIRFCALRYFCFAFCDVRCLDDVYFGCFSPQSGTRSRCTAVAALTVQTI